MILFLRAYGKKHKVIFFQLEPNSKEQDESSDTLIQTCKDIGVKTSHHPLFTKHTFVLDLTKSEDELLSAMHNKTRYNIKIAQKHTVQVKEDNSKEAFDEYLKLNEETTKRQGFYAHTSSYHKRMWENLHPAGIAKLWTARYNNTVVAAWILFVWNKTLYYPYGTSSREHRNVMAPYLLLWNIIKWAKEQKLTSFDLWGALGEHPDEKDPFYGFHKFKSGFSPTLVTFQGSFDIVIFPFWYQCYCIADTIRWKLLKLFK
jgi:lipid II:glycine glycyltransferase (peptidoglycan interpeptide bridge formation enzyme)